MRIALAADSYPPMRNSAAVQLRDLTREFVRQGHEIIMLVPDSGLKAAWAVIETDGVTVVRLRTPKSRHTNWIRRALGELAMPWWMLRNFRASPLGKLPLDAIVWYSPTIFLGALAGAIKRRHRCPSYLIIRDIFPDWMADMGLISRGPAYRFLQAVAAYQYRVADVIGVQTPGNRIFFEKWARRGKTIEVLQNWLTESPASHCSIDVSATTLKGRKVFVYAGNMGIAQGMGKMLDLADALRDDDRIGFLFVGRGTSAQELKEDAARRGLDNVLFHDEIDPDEIPGLYAQVSVGLVSLDARHATHNIPGKFISYMHAGLPVLASINPGNDLEAIVNGEGVGRVSCDPTGADLAEMARAMIEEMDVEATRMRCTALARSLFSSEAAVQQIIAALSSR